MKAQKYVWIIYFIVCSLYLSGCKESKAKKDAKLMGTFVEITVWDQNKANACSAIEDAIKAMEEVEGLAGIYKKGSEIDKLNSRGREKLSSKLFFLIKQACFIGDITEGAFDITIFPLANLWKNNIAENKIPSDEDVALLKEFVDYKKIVFGDDNEVYFKKKKMAIDLGGIAKGYAVDVAVDALKKYKVKGALVNAGGDIFVLGEKKGGRWLVGLQHPRIKGRILGTIQVKDKAVFTSGDYERFFIKNGIRYHHIIDPRTGYPVNGAISVTILADSGYMADGLATGILVLGSAKGMELIESIPGIEGIIIDENGNMIFSSGFRDSNLYRGKKLVLWK